jgi:hypothetical protein
MALSLNGFSFVHIKGVLFRFEKIKDYPPQVLYVTSTYKMYQDIFLIKNEYNKWELMDSDTNANANLFIDRIGDDLITAAKDM